MIDGDGHIGKAKIEGGVDAIIIGGAPDGLVAAAYLARAGLKTVLLEASGEIGAPYRRAATDGGHNELDGEHLFHTLDPQTIDDLDLYSCGVAYSARRMGVAYFFEDGECLRLGGDLRAAAQDAEPDGDAFMQFITDAFEASSFLRPLFTGAPGATRAFKTALAAAPPRPGVVAGAMDGAAGRRGARRIFPRQRRKNRHACGSGVSERRPAA